MNWKLSEWNARFAGEGNKTPMTREEIALATIQLRENNYPKPGDCPGVECPDYRPACSLGICKIAVGMCGDF